jgi:uncharacterized membrane protein YhaH (DUF805 family)
MCAEEQKELNKDRFIRWQRITIEQLGFVNNLFLVFSAGVFTYFNSFINDATVLHHSVKLIFIISVIFNIISFLSGVFCALNRLSDFRLTKDIAKDVSAGLPSAKLSGDRALTKVLGYVTWILFHIQVYTLLLAWIFILLLVYLNNYHKF